MRAQRMGHGDGRGAAALIGQRQEFLDQRVFGSFEQHGNKERDHHRRIGQACAAFQTGDLLAAVADGAPHLVLGKARAFAQQAQRCAKCEREPGQVGTRHKMSPWMDASVLW